MKGLLLVDIETGAILDPRNCVLVSASISEDMGDFQLVRYAKRVGQGIRPASCEQCDSPLDRFGDRFETAPDTHCDYC